MNRYFHPDLRNIIDNFEYGACQKYKVDGRGFGHFPARDVRTAPWEQVDTDLIRVTGLAELIRINNKTSEHVAAKFEVSWLSRYPRLFSCCHDNGGDSFGWEFQNLLTGFGLKTFQPLVAILLQMVHVNT